VEAGGEINVSAVLPERERPRNSLNMKIGGDEKTFNLCWDSNPKVLTLMHEIHCSLTL
jgi:hypothetical protein